MSLSYDDISRFSKVNFNDTMTMVRIKNLGKTNGGVVAFHKKAFLH